MNELSALSGGSVEARFVSDYVPTRLHHWSSAAPKCLPSVASGLYPYTWWAQLAPSEK